MPAWIAQEHEIANRKERLPRKYIYNSSVRNRLLTQQDEYVPEESGFIRNLSESGICISTANRLSVHDVISLYFRLPAVDYNFFVKAKVVWVKDEKAGCEFLHLTEEEKGLIKSDIENMDVPSLW
jgi:Tfp pilus assembly protein PilZ